MLACTEVESAWKGVLVANEYSSLKNDRFSTNDYCRLNTALKLDEWELGLTMFSSYGTIAPFRGWEASRPTQSLPWYEAYNETKHDRETSLHRANWKA